MDEGRQALAQVCRGRLVLSMQFWLWRMQAWLHKPSWTSKPEAPVHLAAQEESVRGLCEALRLDDEELLQTPYVIVVCTVTPAPRLLLEHVCSVASRLPFRLRSLRNDAISSGCCLVQSLLVAELGTG